MSQINNEKWVQHGTKSPDYKCPNHTTVKKINGEKKIEPLLRNRVFIYLF